MKNERFERYIYTGVTAILVLIAGIAGFIVISIYLPIFNIYDMM